MFDNKHAFLLSAFLLGAGVATGGYFIGNTVYKAKVASNIATVKGLAEREVKSDVAVWNVGFEVNEPTIERAYQVGNENKTKVVEFLKQAGFADEEITPNALTVNKRESRDNNNRLLDVSYQIYGAVTVRSEKVDAVTTASQKAGDLVGQGVLLTSSYPQYMFTKLNDIKPEMLGEATRNARVAAEQFAQDANAKVGSISTADQGAFSVSARDNGESGGEDTSSLYKKVRVVTNISFYLKD